MAPEKLAARDEKCAAPAHVTPLCGERTQNAGSTQMVGFLWNVRRDRADARVVPVSTTGEDQFGGKIVWLPQDEPCYELVLEKQVSGHYQGLPTVSIPSKWGCARFSGLNLNHRPRRFENSWNQIHPCSHAVRTSKLLHHDRGVQSSAVCAWMRRAL